MLEETPPWLKKAAKELLKADSEKANSVLRERVRALEEELFAAKSEISKLNRKVSKLSKLTESEIDGLVTWGLEANADPANAVNKVTQDTLDLILDRRVELGPNLTEPRKALPTFDSRSIIERGRWLELELPDDPVDQPKGESIEKTDVGGGQLPRQD